MGKPGTGDAVSPAFRGRLPGELKHLITPRNRKQSATIEQKLPGYQVDAVGTDHEEDQFIIAATSDRTPGSRYLFNVESGELTNSPTSRHGSRRTNWRR